MKNEGNVTIPLKRFKELESAEETLQAELKKVIDTNRKLNEDLEKEKKAKTFYVRVSTRIRHLAFPYKNSIFTIDYNDCYIESNFDSSHNYTISPEFREIYKIIHNAEVENNKKNSIIERIEKQIYDQNREIQRLNDRLSKKVNFLRRILILFTGRL